MKCVPCATNPRLDSFVNDVIAKRVIAGCFVDVKILTVNVVETAIILCVQNVASHKNFHLIEEDLALLC